MLIGMVSLLRTVFAANAKRCCCIGAVCVSAVDRVLYVGSGIRVVYWLTLKLLLLLSLLLSAAPNRHMYPLLYP